MNAPPSGILDNESNVGQEQLDPRWEGAFIGIEHWHFHSQLLKRYGIVLAPGEFSGLVGDLKNGKAKVIEHLSKKRAVYLFRIKSAQERIYVLVENSRIITALPPSRRLSHLRRNLFSGSADLPVKPAN